MLRSTSNKSLGTRLRIRAFLYSNYLRQTSFMPTFDVDMYLLGLRIRRLPMKFKEYILVYFNYAFIYTILFYYPSIFVIAMMQNHIPGNKYINSTGDFLKETQKNIGLVWQYLWAYVWYSFLFNLAIIVLEKAWQKLGINIQTMSEPDIVKLVLRDDVKDLIRLHSAEVRADATVKVKSIFYAQTREYKLSYLASISRANAAQIIIGDYYAVGVIKKIEHVLAKLPRSIITGKILSYLTQEEILKLHELSLVYSIFGYFEFDPLEKHNAVRDFLKNDLHNSLKRCTSSTVAPQPLTIQYKRSQIKPKPSRFETDEPDIENQLDRVSHHESVYARMFP